MAFGQGFLFKSDYSHRGKKSGCRGKRAKVFFGGRGRGEERGEPHKNRPSHQSFWRGKGGRGGGKILLSHKREQTALGPNKG